jgi:DNA-binding MurR/RpiR family transcriptional regulator
VYKERIREIYQHLSPGYRRIADFLLNSYHDAAFMTAAQVGKAADVDTTLVVRFAQRLGYPGFPEMIADVQEDVKRDLRTVYETSPEDDSPAGVLRRTLTQDRNSLEYMLLHMDADKVEKVVELLVKAPRIFVAGESSSAYLAEAVVARLVALGFDGHLVPNELAAQAAATTALRPGDVFLGFGIITVSPSVAAILKVARSLGAHTIGIVGSFINPVASVAEHVLLAPVDATGILPAWTSAAAMAHGLVQAMAVSRDDLSTQSVTRTAHLLELYSEALREQIPSAQQILAGYNLRGTS